MRLIGLRERFITYDPGYLYLSIILQLAMAPWLGHFYDTRISMATGYLIATGQNPYIAKDLTDVFQNPAFQGMTSVGYPPPWPLILGLIYKAVYPMFSNLFIYNLAIKIPTILANIGLAYLVADILKTQRVETKTIRWAWKYLLVNPALIYFGAAWGQFDSMVAFFSMLSLALIQAGKIKISGFILALAVALKPTALPIFLVVLVALLVISIRRAFWYTVVFLASVCLLCVIPFVIFRWNPAPIIQGWNAHFIVAGGMSILTFYELLKDTYQLPQSWWLLGLAWIPALAVGIYWIRFGSFGFIDLVRKCTVLILIFFLTRTWLSEQNLVLVLPFVVILSTMGGLDRHVLAAVWILPLVFTILNTSPPQLLFLAFSDWMTQLLKLDEQFRSVRLVLRTILVIPWQIIGWWIVITCLRNKSLPFTKGMHGDNNSIICGRIY